MGQRRYKLRVLVVLRDLRETRLSRLAVQGQRL